MHAVICNRGVQNCQRYFCLINSFGSYIVSLVCLYIVQYALSTFAFAFRSNIVLSSYTLHSFALQSTCALSACTCFNTDILGGGDREEGGGGASKQKRIREQVILRL